MIFFLVVIFFLYYYYYYTLTIIIRVSNIIDIIFQAESSPSPIGTTILLNQITFVIIISLYYCYCDLLLL